jgi:hypothetical protein
MGSMGRRMEGRRSWGLRNTILGFFSAAPRLSLHSYSLRIGKPSFP